MQVATMFAVMKETDYMQKQKFLDNFWRGFKQVSARPHCLIMPGVQAST